MQAKQSLKRVDHKRKLCSFFSLSLWYRKTYHDLNVVKDDTADEPDTRPNTSICRDWYVGTNLLIEQTECLCDKSKKLLQQGTQPEGTYLCSWVYFCRRMYVNITNHYCALCSITTSQHLRRCQPELRKIESRAPQRHPAQKSTNR